jgi:MFS family permease
VAKINEKQTMITKIILLLGANIALMAGSSLSPVMPEMLSSMSGMPAAAFFVSMIITLPALFVVLGGPLVGWLTDRLGRKPVLILSFLIGGFGGSAAFFWDAIIPILITRAFVGLSIAGTTTATNALIADYFEGQKRSNFMGLNAAFTGLMGVIYVLVGGILADINWHLAYLAYIPLIILTPFAWIFISEPKNERSVSQDKGHTVFELTKTKIYIFAAIFLSQFTFMTIPLNIAYYMNGLLGASGWQIGLVSAFSGLFSFMGGVLYGRLSRKSSFTKLTLGGFLLLGTGLLILGIGRNWLMIVLGQLIGGFCIGINVANLSTWLSNEFSEKVRGRANGIFVTMLYLGNFTSSFFFTPLINQTSIPFAFIVSGGMIILTGILGYIILVRDNSGKRL